MRLWPCRHFWLRVQPKDWDTSKSYKWCPRCDQVKHRGWRSIDKYTKMTGSQVSVVFASGAVVVSPEFDLHKICVKDTKWVAGQALRLGKLEGEKLRPGGWRMEE